MSRKEILRMARDAGFEVHDRKQQARVGLDALVGIDSTEKLERFAALVAAAERDACAILMGNLRAKSRNHLFRSALTAAEGEIRARGTP